MALDKLAVKVGMGRSPLYSDFSSTENTRSKGYLSCSIIGESLSWIYSIPSYSAKSPR